MQILCNNKSLIFVYLTKVCTDNQHIRFFFFFFISSFSVSQEHRMHCREFVWISHHRNSLRIILHEQLMRCNLKMQRQWNIIKFTVSRDSFWCENWHKWKHPFCNKTPWEWNLLILVSPTKISNLLAFNDHLTARFQCLFRFIFLKIRLFLLQFVPFQRESSSVI